MNILKNDRTRRVLIWVVLPLVVYTLVALILTWPLPKHLNRDAAGVGYGDSYMMIRSAWAANQSVRAGHNPMKQTLIAYPDGFTSALMWSTPLRWIPGMLLMFVFSPLMSFNLWLIGTVVLNGITAYWLGMELSDRHIPAALLGGIVFTAFPNTQGHLSVGHIDVLAMYGLPLLALSLWRILHRGAGWRTVGWGGVWFALSCLGLSSQILFSVMPLVVFMGLYALLWDRDRLFPRDQPLRCQPWLKIGAVIVWGGLILMIFFGPLLTPKGRAEVDILRADGRVSYSADALAFVSPSPFGPLNDLGLVPDYARKVLGINSTEGSAYLGVVAFALVIFAVARRRESRGWVVVLLGAMILSLGPLLKWDNKVVKFHVETFHSYVTLPLAALEDLPVFASTRTPGRFNGATSLAWGALVSMGAGVALRRRDVQIALAVVLGAAILFEYQLFWPYGTGSAAQPDYFRQLAKAKDVRAVMNVPIDDSVAVMEAMYQQTIHGKPMVGGQLFRHTPQNPAEIALLSWAGSDYLYAPSLLPAEMDSKKYIFSALGVDRVIVHKRFLRNVDQVLGDLRAMFGEPEYEDASMAAFVVPRLSTPPADTSAWAAEFRGWYKEEGDAASNPAIFLHTSGEWYFYLPQETYGEWQFKTSPVNVSRRLAVWLDNRLITAWWVKDEQVNLPLWLPAGFHTLRFQSMNGCDSYPYQLSCLEKAPVDGACEWSWQYYCVSMKFDPESWTPVDTTSGERGLIPLDVSLDHGVRLRAYEFYQDASKPELHVRLFWAANHSLPKSYALFVHLADPKTMEPLAQYADYPLILTTAWGDDSRWQSDITITLPEGFPAGEYAVNTGWFDPVDHTRLAVQGDRPWASAGIVHLGMIKIK